MGMYGGGEAPPTVEETPQEKELAKVTSEQWERYKTKFRPVEDIYLEEIHKDIADEAQVTGQVSAGVGRRFGEERKEAERGMFAGGVRPGSGKVRAAVGGLGIERAKTAGAGMARGAQAVDDTTIINLMNAIKMGRGEATEATRDITTLAREATAEAIEGAYAREGRRQAEKDVLGSTVATAAGMGLAGWRGAKKET